MSEVQTIFPKLISSQIVDRYTDLISNTNCLNLRSKNALRARAYREKFMFSILLVILNANTTKYIFGPIIIIITILYRIAKPVLCMCPNFNTYILHLSTHILSTNFVS